MNRRGSISAWGVGLCLVATCAAAPAPTTAPRRARRSYPDADRVVIVVNEAVPESVRLGEYYASRRGVLRSRVCRLRTSTAETIDRARFESEIRGPLRRFLFDKLLVVRRGKLLLSKVHYIVTVYGVPVRVAAQKGVKIDPRAKKFRDNASVDSELTLTLLERAPTVGFARNPYFNQRTPFGRCRIVVKNTRLAFPLSSVMVLVTRLDGPSEPIVRRMIDDAIATEATGLVGKAYVDVRGIKKGAYIAGDRWLAGAAKRLTAVGYDCEVESTGKLFAPDHAFPDAALYLGWYTGHAYGRFLDPKFRFARGAIAYHLHSFSAAVVRDEKRHWVGPLLTRGAAVTIGHVYEPYLQFTTRVDVFIDRLLGGRNFAEAAYASIPVLSWQNVFLGDPLYRPFAVRRTARTRPSATQDTPASRPKAVGKAK